MPHTLNREEIQAISDDLKIFLNAVNGPINKLDYLNTISPVVENAGSIEMGYQIENINIIPEVENAVILQMEQAEKKEISVQLHLSPASYIVPADKLFLRQIFFRLINYLMEASQKKSVISVYVTESDGKSNIEFLNQKNPFNKKEEDNYFKKYRINNPVNTTQSTEGRILPVFKKMIEDMNGELSYSFNDEKEIYFRLKFPLV